MSRKVIKRYHPILHLNLGVISNLKNQNQPKSEGHEQLKNIPGL